MIAAQSLVKHTAKLRFVDFDGKEHVEHHSAWTAGHAATMAWGRAKSLILSGQAAAFRIEHSERVFAQGDVLPAGDPFAIPAYRQVAGLTAA